MAQITCRAPTVAPTASMSGLKATSMRSFSANKLAPAFRGAVAARPFTAVPRRSSLKTCAVLAVTEETFEAEVLKADLPVLVDFWATWCGPCKLVAPSMEWAEKTFGSDLKVVKIDCTDTNKGLMEQFKVYGLPCLIVFKNGEQLDGSHREGAITRKDLMKYLEKHVGVTAPAD